MMRMDKLTSKFQLALQDAQSLALRNDHQHMEPVHVMVAFLDQEGGSARGLMSKAGVNINALRSQLGEQIENLPVVTGGDAGDVHVSGDLNRLLNVSDKLAQKRGDQYISSELFILAATEDKGQLGKLLKANGATNAIIEKAIDDVRGGQSVDDPNAEDQREALEKYTTDLTCLLYTSPSPRDGLLSRMPSSA